MKETYELIQLNKINVNSRKYVKESFKAFPYSVPVYFGRDIGVLPHGASDFEYIVGQASNFKIDDKVVTCEIDLLDSKIKKINKPIYCTATGIGELRPDATVKDYVLKCVDLCYNSSFEDIRNKMILKLPSLMETE